MTQLPDKIRIKDIAAMAGVSKGTVDRVIHNRGEVSKSSREKVEKVLLELNYKPNVYASALASKKKYHFICIIPKHTHNDYWALVEKGIRKQSEQLLDLNISVKLIYFNQFDVESFNCLLSDITTMNADAVLFTPVFKELSIKLAGYLEEKSIPYVFIDSLIEEVSPLAYFGMHSAKSGELAAKLLFAEKDNIDEIVMFHALRKGQTGANQTLLRKNGFIKYINDKYPSCKIYSVGLYFNNDEENKKILDDFFENHKEINAGVTFNSRVFMIADYFKQNKIENVKLIGYDSLERNIKALKSGHVEFIISQRPEIQGYRALKALADYLIFKHDIQKINYMPMDILTYENIDFYINFPSI